MTHQRKFRVEWQWKDNVGCEPTIYAFHHDFPDASRASAAAVAFVPAGDPLEPRTDMHEVLRSADAVVKLFEVAR